MPMAVPTMPDSLIGVSKQRFLPYFCCRPWVQRKTPPKKPTSSPNTTTFSSRSMATSMASRIASIIVLRGMASDPRFLALSPEMRRHLGIDTFKHVAHRRLVAGVQRAVFLRLALGCDHAIQNLRLGLRMPLLRPDPAPDQVILQSNDRITERPGGRLLLWPIGGRIVRRRVGAGAIGHMLDQCGSEIPARPLCCPSGHRVHRKIVVSIDPQRRNAETQSPRRKSACPAAGDALEGRNRPLIVDDIQDDWRLVC